jgi:hypothetical protein
MNSVYHTLAIFDGGRGAVHESIVEWLGYSKFRIDVQNGETRIVAVYPGWYGCGVTDAQTASELEILLQDTDGQTAVSFCHRTRQFFVLAGVMMGNILEVEVCSLISCLEKEFGLS